MSLLRLFHRSSNRSTIADNNNTRRSMTSFVTSEVEGTPRAVVLLLGFAGAKPKHLAKYAKIYNLNQCSTVSGTASNYDIFSGNKAAQDAMAMDAVQEVTKILRSCDDEAAKHSKSPKQKTETPVVMHILSNGGTFVSTRLSLLLESAAESKNDDQATADLLLFKNRLKLGYQIFDSAPGYFTMKASFNVIKHLIPNKLVAFPAATVFTTFVVLWSATAVVTRRPTQGEQFWNLLLDDTACMRQAYIYSHGDDICDATKIEEMAEERKKRGAHVMTKHFEDSTHVQHLRLHEIEYKEFIAGILKDMVEKNKQ